MDIEEVDIYEFSKRDEEVPHSRTYIVRIDDQKVRFNSPYPTGEELLERVGKKSCAYELIEELVHGETKVVEPEEEVNLRERGLKGFVTTHRKIVTISINDKPYQIESGDRSVSEILNLVGQKPDGYVLFEEKEGPPMPLPDNVPVRVEGCEVFYSQPQSGGSS